MHSIAEFPYDPPQATRTYYHHEKWKKVNLFDACAVVVLNDCLPSSCDYRCVVIRVAPRASEIRSQASWEKFCNDISLETNHTESWGKIKTPLKSKGKRDYLALRLDAKTAKTNADKAQLFAKSVERHFGIQSNNFDSNHLDEVNQFIEDNYEYFYPPEDTDDHRSDMDNDHDPVADVDSDTLIKIVKFLKRSKAPGPDNIHNEVLRSGTTTSLFHYLARLFTSSIQIGHIPTAWKLATPCMLLKPDKLPFFTTSYRLISLLSSIMKLFERVIEQGYAPI